MAGVEGAGQEAPVGNMGRCGPRVLFMRVAAAIHGDALAQQNIAHESWSVRVRNHCGNQGSGGA